MDHILFDKFIHFWAILLTDEVANFGPYFDKGVLLLTRLKPTEIIEVTFCGPLGSYEIVRPISFNDRQISLYDRQISFYDRSRR